MRNVLLICLFLSSVGSAETHNGNGNLRRSFSETSSGGGVDSTCAVGRAGSGASVATPPPLYDTAPPTPAKPVSTPAPTSTPRPTPKATRVKVDGKKESCPEICTAEDAPVKCKAQLWYDDMGTKAEVSASNRCEALVKFCKKPMADLGPNGTDAFPDSIEIISCESDK